MFGPSSENINSTTTKTTTRDITTIYGQGYTEYALYVDTSNWATTDTIVWSIEFSPDGGTTWGWGATNGPAGVSGGTHRTLPGSAEPWPSIGGELPQSDDPAATGAGWPTAQPAQVLARGSITCSALPSPRNVQVAILVA
jgi:hypothetical protein